MNKQTRMIEDSIKPFEWEELNGRTLQIVAGKQEGVMIVVGYDQETKDVYVLHEEFSKSPIPLPTIKPGDRVNHKLKRHLINGEVKQIQSSKAFVLFPAWMTNGYFPLSDLELIPNE